MVDERKLRVYRLTSAHPRGKHKARVFAAALEMAAQNAGELRAALLLAVRTGESIPTVADEHGQRCLIDFEMTSETGNTIVRRSWMVRSGENFPRFITCWVR